MHVHAYDMYLSVYAHVNVCFDGGNKRLGSGEIKMFWK